MRVYNEDKKLRNKLVALLCDREEKEREKQVHPPLWDILPILEDELDPTVLMVSENQFKLAYRNKLKLEFVGSPT